MQCLDASSLNNMGSDKQLEPGNEKLEDIEKQHILKVLNDEQGNKSAAARRLGVSRKTLERKVKRWNAAS
jgi:two-component system NtrC family response regulator